MLATVESKENYIFHSSKYIKNSQYSENREKTFPFRWPIRVHALDVQSALAVASSESLACSTRGRSVHIMIPHPKVSPAAREDVASIL